MCVSDRVPSPGVKLTRYHGVLARLSARLFLAVTNVFDTRERVHDVTGVTPTAFEPDVRRPKL
jgi:hypothetical protein